MRCANSIRKALRYPYALTSIALATLLFMAAPASAQINLGTAGNFGVLAGSAVTNTGSSVIGADLGVSPGSAVTGFPPGVVTPPGTIHSADATAAQAQIDLTTAYTTAAAMPTLVNLTGTDLGGLTLTPGVYGFASSAQLTGTLTLDALGNPSAVFVFKMGSTLTTASGSSVKVINGGTSCNVFWQIGSSATFGTTTTFAGNVLALGSITLNTGVNLGGRALARNGAVTLAGNNVSACGVQAICPVISISPAALPGGSVGASYNQTVSASGGVAPYFYSVVGGVLPAGLSLNSATGAITGTLTTAGTFNFTIQGTDANGCPGTRPYVIVVTAVICPAIVLNPASLPGAFIGVPYSQSISATGGVAPYIYAVVSGALPTGLVLNPATGAITGTPTGAGTFNFTIRGTDANGCPGQLSYALTVAIVPVTADIPTLSQWGLIILMMLAALIAMVRLRRI